MADDFRSIVPHRRARRLGPATRRPQSQGDPPARKGGAFGPATLAVLQGKQRQNGNGVTTRRTRSSSMGMGSSTERLDRSRQRMVQKTRPARAFTSAAPVDSEREREIRDVQRAARLLRAQNQKGPNERSMGRRPFAKSAPLRKISDTAMSIISEMSLESGQRRTSIPATRSPQRTSRELSRLRPQPAGLSTRVRAHRTQTGYNITSQRHYSQSEHAHERAQRTYTGYNMNSSRHLLAQAAPPPPAPKWDRPRRMPTDYNDNAQRHQYMLGDSSRYIRASPSHASSNGMGFSTVSLIPAPPPGRLGTMPPPMFRSVSDARSYQSQASDDRSLETVLERATSRRSQRLSLKLRQSLEPSSG